MGRFCTHCPANRRCGSSLPVAGKFWHALCLTRGSGYHDRDRGNPYLSWGLVGRSWGNPSADAYTRPDFHVNECTYGDGYPVGNSVIDGDTNPEADTNGNVNANADPDGYANESADRNIVGDTDTDVVSHPTAVGNTIGNRNFGSAVEYTYRKAGDCDRNSCGEDASPRGDRNALRRALCLVGDRSAIRPACGVVVGAGMLCQHHRLV